MLSSKPIALGKTAPVKSRCGYARAAAKKSSGYNLRVQPFAGMAFVPSPVTAASDNGYVANAGNWKTAFITGANVEVGKGAARKFVVGLQYLQGLGMKTENFAAMKEGAPYNAAVKPYATAWNVTVGVPISLTKAKKAPEAAKPTPAPEVKKTSCSSYRKRCGNWQ